MQSLRDMALARFFRDDGSWKRTRPEGATYHNGGVRPAFFVKVVVYDDPNRPDCREIIGMVDEKMGRGSNKCMTFRSEDKSTKYMLISEDALNAMRGGPDKAPAR